MGDLIAEVTGDLVEEAVGDLVADVTGDLVAEITGDLVAEVRGDLVAEVTGDLVAEGTLDDLKLGVAFNCGGGGGVLQFEPLPEEIEKVIDFDLHCLKYQLSLKYHGTNQFVRLYGQCSAFRQFLPAWKARAAEGIVSES